MVDTRVMPESITWRVAHSWRLISDRIDQIGVRFFLQMFEARPELLEMFHFGGMDIFGSDADLPAPLKAHAIVVMRTIGECVSGNIKIEAAIPKLRSIGQVHAISGVQDYHYNVVFEHLMETISQELGPDNWNAELREAWELTFRSLTSVIKRPDDFFELEGLAGWAMVNAVACGYIAFFTPFRMAGFCMERRSIENFLSFSTTIAGIILTIDALSHTIANYWRFEIHEIHTKEKTGAVAWLQNKVRKLFFPLTLRVKRFIRGLKMERWPSWPTMDAIILISYVLQHSMILVDMAKDGVTESWSKPTTPGVHWTYVFGLLRLAALFRVVSKLCY
jgi:hemoglobin-like flavoprotein